MDSTFQQLESQRYLNKTIEHVEPTYPPPKFSRFLKQTITEKEGRSVHLEAQLQEPISDPNLRIIWERNGQSITASSRITTISNCESIISK